MNTLQDEFDNLLNEQRELRAKFQVKAQELFKQTTKEFFDKNPGVTAVRWNQYTPYFNDGSPCVFTVYTPYITNCPLDELHDFSQWGEYDGDREDVFAVDNISWVLKSDSTYYKKEQAILTKLVGEGKIDPASITRFTSMIENGDMDSIMEAMFGDHVTVTATRDGFEVVECDHD